MKKIIQKYNKPGVWEVVIKYDRVGKDGEWVGIVDGRVRGEYKLTVVADHTVSRTTGRVTVRAVCGVDSVVNIKGIIRIGQEAQETNNFLELRVLTLGPKSRATASPELEILANNVAAGHAASIGYIDPMQMLYLQSRGLSQIVSEEQIVKGWLGV